MYEALVRMIDDDGSEVLPGLFLEAAKRGSLYRAITHRMVRKALADFSAMRLPISIILPSAISRRGNRRGYF
jgi:EAL domain-containing protein (putative c-di-GMP-specific phosphodiesterase class I)